MVREMRNRRRKIFIYLSVAVLVVGAVMLYLSVVHDITELPKELQKGKSKESSVMANVVLWRDLKDGRKLRLQAASVKRGADVIDAEDVRVTVFRDGNLEYIVLAKSGRYVLKKHTVYLKGNVRVRDVEREVEITTDNLRWDTEKGFIYSDSSVNIYRKDGTTVVGNRLKGSISSGRWVVEGNVRVIIPGGER